MPTINILSGRTWTKHGDDLFVFDYFGFREKYMKAFTFPICGGSTEKIWENENKTRFGMKCSEGHDKTGGKSEGSKISNNSCFK